MPSLRPCTATRLTQLRHCLWYNLKQRVLFHQRFGNRSLCAEGSIHPFVLGWQGRAGKAAGVSREGRDCRPSLGAYILWDLKDGVQPRDQLAHHAPFCLGLWAPGEEVMWPALPREMPTTMPHSLKAIRNWYEGFLVSVSPPWEIYKSCHSGTREHVMIL